MRLKWYGVLLLLLDLVLMIPKYSPAAGLILVITGVVLVVIDCRKDDKEYIEKMKKELTKQKIEGESRTPYLRYEALRKNWRIDIKERG